MIANREQGWLAIGPILHRVPLTAALPSERGYDHYQLFFFCAELQPKANSVIIHFGGLFIDDSSVLINQSFEFCFSRARSYYTWAYIKSKH